MEVQGLQEALKVEIQCHQKLVAPMKDPQDGELKTQLHDRQTRITALNERQKLAVRGSPVGNARPLSLIQPPSPNIAISVLPARAPAISVVTAHINGQKAQGSEPLQGAPLNLQSPRVGEPPHSQMLGSLAPLPLKVPQVSSLQRLAVQAPALLPQVRPKTLIPDSLPHSPAQDPPRCLPGLQRVTAVISPRVQGPALPAPNTTARPLQPLANGQPEPDSASISSGGVAYAIISTSSAAGPASVSVNPTSVNVSPASVSISPVSVSVSPASVSVSPASASISPVSVSVSPASVSVSPVPVSVSPVSVSISPTSLAIHEAVKVQPLLLSTDSKVIIIQPQAASPPPQPSSPPSPSPPVKKREEDPEKIAFMVALGLVTTEHLEEIQSKRQERKRRSTANPAYSGLLEPERKRLASHYLNSPLYLSAQDTEDLCWKEGSEHEEVCVLCKEEGELQPCHTCPRSYHPDCLQPPLKTPPKGTWMCPKCQKKMLSKNLSWPQTFIQSYTAHKTVREEEKRRLMRRNRELKREWDSLEEQDLRLNHAIMKCMELKERLMGRQREAQSSLERLKALIRLIQRDQVLQLTMTTTTLLPLPWIKPTSTPTAPSVGTSMLLQKSHTSPANN